MNLLVTVNRDEPRWRGRSGSAGWLVVSLLMLAMLAGLPSLTGCVSNVSGRMAVVDDEQVPPLAPGKSRVVFLRPLNKGMSVQASVFDITSGEPEFMGITSYGARLFVDLAPGMHKLMVVSENAGFMEAHLAPDRTYYVVVVGEKGRWKARFTLQPVSAAMRNTPKYRKWMAKGPWTVVTDSARTWADANTASIRNRMNDFLPEWEARADKPILYEEDGT